MEHTEAAEETSGGKKMVTFVPVGEELLGLVHQKEEGLKPEVDLVTHSDKACEDLIFNHLKKLYPTHKVLQNLLITHMDS
ncbi:hypothetical protein K1719_017980 [Acacia pycnantha]|nr:hypothetical protein K1719_017980 [Acacia pycnantha]